LTALEINSAAADEKKILDLGPWPEVLLTGGKNQRQEIRAWTGS
jgi:hypothetical protein